MPNLGKIVAGHNARVASPTTNLREKNCNCRGKNAICMMEGARCMDKEVVYQAEVTAPSKPLMKYVGVCAPEWKSRYRNHKTDFKYTEKRKHTKLAGYVWSLKDEGILHDDITIKWRILAHCSSFKASNNTCRLCLTGKIYPDAQAPGGDHQCQGRVLFGLPAQARTFTVICCKNFLLVRNFCLL